MGLFDNIFNKPQAEPITPEEAERKLAQINKQIESAQIELQNKIRELEKAKAELSSLQYQIRNMREQIDDELNIQSYGLYVPTFKFSNSDLYKDRLKACRDRQKELIKRDNACYGNMGWTVNGDVSKGQKMVKDMQKLLLRAFNVECDEIVNNVKITNYEKSKERIYKSANQISKLGTIMSI